MDTIVVEPLAECWTVRTDRIANDLVFRTGSLAEQAARALALRLAEAGEPVRLKLRLRDSQLAARFVCLPPLDPTDRARLIDLPPLPETASATVPPSGDGP